MLNAELIVAYVFWEGKEGWDQILERNEWPPDTEITTTWRVKNTGDEAAFFKVRFMGLESAGALLNPGEEGTLYLYCATPSAGSHSYTMEIIADGQVVQRYPLEIITSLPRGCGTLPAVVFALCLIAAAFAAAFAFS